MVKSILLLILIPLCGLMGFSSLLNITPVCSTPTGSAALQGTVTEALNGEPVLFASVALYQDGVFKTGTETDFDGNYQFVNLDPGTYAIEVKYTGFETWRMDAIPLMEGKMHRVDVTLKTAGLLLSEVVVREYRIPTVEQDQTTQGATITSSEIRNLPTRNINGLRASTAGLSGSPKEGQEVRLRASRSDATNYYVDGVRVSADGAPMQSSPAAATSPTVRPADPTQNEQYNTIVENAFVATTQENFSTFGIDVDAASYSNVRRFLRQGQLPPADAVRLEELINYFHYEYAPPRGEHPFRVESELATCPWQPEHQLLLVGLRGQSVSDQQLPAANFVFLLDVSGSMNRANKLPLLVQSLEMLTDNLRETDKVSIVVYAGAAGVVLEPTSGADKQKIKEALKRLRAGGSTAGAAGIRKAYALAREQFIEGGNNRVILATDGDFNVGVSGQEELEALITKEREGGIFLSVLGFGTGNLQDGKMETLADKGNGNYAYIDQLSEARKVLVREFGGTLFTIAKDVKLQLEFKPEQLASYRLIGYENRLLAKEDFRDDRKDAGELGAGHTVTALYEIVPHANAKQQEAVAILRLRYKAPDSNTATEFAHELAAEARDFGQASTNLRWAATTAEWGMLLRNSTYKGKATYPHCAQIARQALGRDPFGYRSEMIELINTAQRLTQELAKK
ncbi:MAG: DUF3520 domain-containing protein [Bacteroidetes bacterium]|nr:MAG: DUF3520 domain-containing protein [Bacteroidota bacterium]